MGLIVGMASLIHVRLVEIVRAVIGAIREHGAGRCHGDNRGERRRGDDRFDVGQF